MMRKDSWPGVLGKYSSAVPFCKSETFSKPDKLLNIEHNVYDNDKDDDDNWDEDGHLTMKMKWLTAFSFPQWRGGTDYRCRSLVTPSQTTKIETLLCHNGWEWSWCCHFHWSLSLPKSLPRSSHGIWCLCTQCCGRASLTKREKTAGFEKNTEWPSRTSNRQWWSF